MPNPRGDVMSRLGSQSAQQFSRNEFVSRGVTKQHNGKPYDRPASASSAGLKPAANGNVKKNRTKAKNYLPVKKYGAIFDGLAPIPTNPTIDPPPRVCFNCWQPGHARKACTRPMVSKMCNNCGRRGVDLTTCPRCRDRHATYMAWKRGEKLDDREFEALFPPTHHFRRSDEVQVQVVLNEDKSLDGGAYEDPLEQLIEQEDDRERQMSRSYYDEERERELTPEEPRVKYVETREYVKNPVSRYREHHDDEEEEEERRRRRHRPQEDDYEYEERERSYDEREQREQEYPLTYRERESSEDRSVERQRRAGNAAASFDLDSDPVHEVLELARSIAHLSPETQELIMRQVMAERKEKARLRAMQHRVEVEEWP